jgi:hypothetical protein
MQSQDKPVAISPHFVHYVSKIKLSMESVGHYMEMLQEVDEDGEASGNTLDRLPLLMWAGKAKKEGLNWHFTSTDFVPMGDIEGVGPRR